MRARVLAVLIAVLASPVLPQCNFAPVFSDLFRSSMLDVAVDGNDLWAATSYGVALYDRSVDPPKLSGVVAVPGTTRIVSIANGQAYAGSGNSIAIVRKNGRALQLVRTVDTGAPVNDIVATTLMLFVATNNGLFQYNANDITAAPVQLTTKPAMSLAFDGSSLDVAEGDPSVEVFSISPFLQHTATITVPSSATAVHVNNGKLYVSTAVQTYVFVAGNNVGSVPFSMTALASPGGDIVFAGTSDRTLRAIDFSTPGNPADIYRADLPPSGGTINRITALASASGRVYAAAGDIGIADFDTSAFTAPFALRHIVFPNASSVVSLGDNFYVGLTSGITEFNQNLLQKRTWDNHTDAVQDGAPGFLLTSSGSSVTLWVLDSLGAVGTATFRAAVVDAVLINNVAYAVLADRTLWSADFSQSATPATVQVDTNGLQPVSIARSGSSYVLADTRSDGTTRVGSVTVPGLATSGVTLYNTIAAVQTFRGINLIDTASGTTTVIPNSSDAIARQLFLSGSTLLELTDSTIRIWNTTARTLTAEIALPSAPLAVHMADSATTADVVTSTGIATIALDRLSKMPVAIAAPNGNAFYKKVIASATRIGLVDARGVDLFTPSMDYAGSIRGGGIVDVAASDTAIYTVSANLTVNAYTPFASLRATATIDEGSDAQALAINTVNGAVWVSIIRGCSTGACEKKTIIFDSTLSRTISLTGGIVDMVVNGSRAYALTDLPTEVRVLNVADPAHPSIIASAAAQGASIAYSNGIVYVLGNNLTSYSEASLTKIADLITATTSTPDERVRIDGGCAIITGRSAAPQMYTLPQFAAVSSTATPATPRGLASQPGVFYVLTDNSLEIWSTSALPKPPARKRASR